MRGFDLLGTVSFVLGLTGLVYGISRGGISGWDDPLVIGSLLAAALLLPLFVLIEHRGRAPMLDLSIFANRMFAAATGAAFINGLSRFALLFVFVFYFQGAQGDDPITAGIKLAPMALGMLVASPLAGDLGRPARLAHARGARHAGQRRALAGMTTLQAGSPYWQSTLWLALVGIGSGMFNSPNTAAMMGTVPVERRGIAAGARTMLQNTGAVISIAFVLAIVTAAVPKPVLFKIFSGLAAGLTSAQLDPFIHNMHTALWVLAATSVVGAGVSLLRPRHDPAFEVPWAEGGRSLTQLGVGRGRHLRHSSEAPASVGRRVRSARRLLLEVLAQHRHLALVVGAQLLAVEALGRRAGALQRQLADRLAVFDHERDVARPHLERRAAAVAAARRVVAEAGIEEAGVVGAQLARGRVVGHHLGGDLGRDADALGREQQVEDLRLEHDPPARLRVDRVPVVGPAVGADPREVDRQAVLLRPVADDPVPRPGEVDAEEETLGERQLGLAQRVRVEVEQRELVLQGADLRVAEAHIAARQAQLVEREAAAHLDREGARHHLQVEAAAVAGGGSRRSGGGGR